jgi:hypothetical protein
MRSASGLGCRGHCPLYPAGHMLVACSSLLVGLLVAPFLGRAAVTTTATLQVRCLPAAVKDRGDWRWPGACVRIAHRTPFLTIEPASRSHVF